MLSSESGLSDHSPMAPDNRKTVKFSENTACLDVKPETICSTSDFLLRSGAQWASVAKAFNCEDMGDDSKRMEELLELCSWDYAESVSSIGSADDDGRRGSTSDLSSHSLAYSERTAEELMKSYEPRLSSLRFESLLKIDSRPKLVARRKSVKKYENYFSEEDKEKMEDAFQGIITDDNITPTGIRIMKKVVEEVNVENIENVEADNFWDEVDF